MFTIVLTVLLIMTLAGIAAVLGPGVSATDLTEMGVRLDDPSAALHDAR